jgi:hypothetical protein
MIKYIFRGLGGKIDDGCNTCIYFLPSSLSHLPTNRILQSLVLRVDRVHIIILALSKPSCYQITSLLAKGDAFYQSSTSFWQ